MAKKKDSEKVVPEVQEELFETPSGEEFEEYFAPTPEFGFLNVQDECHAQGDLLEHYNPNFQASIENLRACTDPDKFNKMSQDAYKVRKRMTQKEWNYWSVDQRICKAKVMKLSEAGERAVSALRATLTGMPEVIVRQYARAELYPKSRIGKDGKTEHQRMGLTGVDVSTLWNVWREFAGEEREDNGLDFVIGG